MGGSFSETIVYNKKSLLAVIVPQLRKDGMYYEVNIKGYPRFFMVWSQLGRFDIADTDLKLPYEVVLAVSDVIEARKK